MNEVRGVSLDDRWIRDRRIPKNPVDPRRPYHFLIEKERTPSGEVEDVLTIFLTNKECRYSCLMCDLWKNTTDRTVPSGAIPEQIAWALERLPPARHLKLYNSANFFDPGAVPPADYQGIAELVQSFDTLIVENHPLLTGERCVQFASMIAPRLQVAMGLETVHTELLGKLNKKMTAADFRNAVAFLKANGIGSRAFILLNLPFLSEEEGTHWAKESVNYAFDSGTDCCTVIPTRTGNGALDRLQSEGYFSPPSISRLEEVQEFGINLEAGDLFADTWDLQQFSTCDLCFEERRIRIEQMNNSQRILPRVSCQCGDLNGTTLQESG